MSTAVFLGFPGHGHIGPALPVVAELVRRGETVVYYSVDPFRPMVEQAGALFRGYGRVPPGCRQTDPVAQMLGCLQLSRSVLDGKLAEIAALEPDYLLYDYCSPWGRHVAQLLELPAVCSIATAMPAHRVRRSGSFLARRSYLRATRPREFAAQHAIARDLRRRYGVRQRTGFAAFANPGRLNLVYTSRMFQPDGDTYDSDRYKFVGPYDPPEQPGGDFPFERLDGRPLLYVSLGTIFADQPAFFRMCFEAFGGTQWQVVMAVGHRLDLAGLGTVPENVLLHRFVPQARVLRRAAAFVSHGGPNSVYDALCQDTPMVVIPHGNDHQVVAERIERLGVGVVLDRHRVDAAALRRAVDRVLADPGFARRTGEVGASLREAGGPVRAADEIEAFRVRVREGASGRGIR